MHPIDLAARGVLHLLPRRRRVFIDGWGDPALLDLLDITTTAAPPPIEVVWERPRLDGEVRLRHGTFVSPISGLPAAAASAFVLGIEREAATGKVCVMLPAWNDEGYLTRRKFAEDLAASGIGTILLEAPFYGTRRCVHGGSPVRTVSDFALMTRAVVEEGRALLAWLTAHDIAAGVAGFSMGGSLAAAVGATTELPVAVAPLAAAHAPAPVFVEGVISASIAWDALGDNGRERLFEQLGRSSVLRLPPTPATSTAVAVGATRDGFVPPAATEAIHAHWPGSEIQWVTAGHATLLWRHRRSLVGAIIRAFERLGAAHLAPGRGDPR